MLEIAACVWAVQLVDGQVEFRAKKMSVNNASPFSSPERTVLFANVTVLYDGVITQAVDGCRMFLSANKSVLMNRIER
jgi:hypothetical protein